MVGGVFEYVTRQKRLSRFSEGPTRATWLLLGTEGDVAAKDSHRVFVHIRWTIAVWEKKKKIHIAESAIPDVAF